MPDAVAQTLGGMRTDVTAADGTRLAVYEWGNPSGREVVLIHGFSQCHLCFAPQILSALGRELRLIAFDMRGHGDSGKPAGAASYQTAHVWADDIAAVLDAKRLARPVLVGWSMGGRVIRQYLMVHGDSRIAGLNFVASLVIEDPSCRGTTPRAAPEGAPLEAEIAARIAFLEACYSRKPSDADFRTALAYNMLIPSDVRRAISGWATAPEPTIAALRRVRVPTLVTHGRRDAIVLPAAAEMTAATIPHARLSWFDDCGHSPFCEDADRFNAELTKFVKDV